MNTQIDIFIVIVLHFVDFLIGTLDYVIIHA